VTVDTLEIVGLDVEFDITKTTALKPNTADVTIYNLNEDHRAQLEQLKAQPGAAATQGIACRVEAGYGDELSQLYLGDLRTADSVRDGPDWLTVLTSGDGEKALAHARINISYGPKTSIELAMRAMARSLGVGEGNLSKVVQQLKIAGSAIWPCGTVISGPTARELADLARSAELEVSIQDQALQFINRGQALDGTALRLAPETGLIGSPTVDNKGICKFTTLLIPDMRAGSLVVLDAARVKGNYRVEVANWVGKTWERDWYIHCEASRF
jgi:hypothetical protein